MGIQGLLPLLKSTMEPIHVKQMEGCSVAVDTYSWLHKGALSCSRDLCKGLPTSRHIEYCMHRVNLLRHYGIKPILVFDGGFLPMKLEQENKRSRSRKENLARALEHEANGNSSGAYECYQKAVDISPSIAHELIQVLQQENVSYVVAPYEADAQMAYLALTHQVDAVVTEDSDLIPFGCPRIIFKMDKYGQGMEFQSSRLQQNQEIGFTGFTKLMLLEMCIFSGCDYLQSLPGMGLKRAHSLITKFKSHDKVIKHLKYSGVSIPSLYEESFKKAIWTFQHQRVYDSLSEDVVHLLDIPDNLTDDLDFLGPLIPQHIAKGIAKGELDPFTQMPFEAKSCNFTPVPNGSSALKSFKHESGRKKLDLPVQKNLLTKYFCFASLEAKRNFRAPRTSPVSHEGGSPIIPEENSSEETRSEINGSPAFRNASDSERNEILPSNSNTDADNCSVAETPDSSVAPSPDTDGTGRDKQTIDHRFLQQSDQANRPCLKECDLNNVCAEVDQKTRTENKKAVVRSRYFQQKVVNTDVEDVFTSDIKKDIRKDSCKAETENKKINVSPCFQHKSVRRNDHDSEFSDPLLTDMPGDDGLDDCHKTRTANKKVTTSSYFQHRLVSKNEMNNERQSIPFKDGPTNNYEDIDYKFAYSETKSCNRITLKRKISLDDDLERVQENLNPKQKIAAASLSGADRCSFHLSSILSNIGCDVPPCEETLMPTEERGKFGSNVTHISQYNEIAEKSMERFASAISSFRYSSASGSRASGLRAPLKDVQNTCTDRPTAVDFSQFAYKPTNKIAGARSRRR